jgi:hypothetical protein
LHGLPVEVCAQSQNRRIGNYFGRNNAWPKGTKSILINLVLFIKGI